MKCLCVINKENPLVFGADVNPLLFVESRCPLVTVRRLVWLQERQIAELQNGLVRGTHKCSPSIRAHGAAAEQDDANAQQTQQRGATSPGLKAGATSPLCTAPDVAQARNDSIQHLKVSAALSSCCVLSRGRYRD